MKHSSSLHSTLTHAVLGPMDPSEVGVTLTHEHLLLDFVKASKLKTKDYVDKLTDLDFQMNNLGKIQHYPYARCSKVLLLLLLLFYTQFMCTHIVTASQPT